MTSDDDLPPASASSDGDGVSEDHQDAVRDPQGDHEARAGELDPSDECDAPNGRGQVDADAKTAAADPADTDGAPNAGDRADDEPDVEDPVDVASNDATADDGDGDGATDDEGAGSIWDDEDDDADYTYVRRSDPGWDMSKWLIAAGIATVTILLSFILIPRIFTASDPEPAATSAPASTAPPTTEPPPVVSYRDIIIGAGPVHFWEFSYNADPGQDAMGTSNLTLGKDIGLLGSSAVKGGAGAIDCSGTNRSRINSQTPETPTGEVSVEVWINTATASGGQIVNFGSAAEGASKQTDRTLFIDHSGLVHFGVRDAKRQVVTSELLINDGKWHHVVGTLSGTDGIKLYVDGQLADHEPKATAAQEFEGHWRICGDSLSGWPGATGSAPLIGSVDEVAIYNRALSADEVAQHHQVAL